MPLFRLRSLALAIVPTLVVAQGCGTQPHAEDASRLANDRLPKPFLTPKAPIPPRSLGITYMNLSVNHRELERIHADPSKQEKTSVLLTVNDRMQREDVEIKIHGGSSKSFDKKSYAIEFKKSDVPLDGTSLLGLSTPEKRRDYILAASWQDGSYLRHSLSYEFIRRMGGEAARMKPIALAFNSTFQGVYLVTEKIDDDFLRDNGLDKDGFLVKAEGGLAVRWRAKSNALKGLEVKSKDIDAGPVMAAFWKDLFDTKVDEASFASTVEKALDLPAFYRWQLINTLANNMDAYRNNFFLYKDVQANAPMKVISWDFDAAWGNLWNGKRNDPTKHGWHSFVGKLSGILARKADYGWYGWDGFSQRLFSIPRYCKEYTDFYQNQLSGELHWSRMHAWIDAEAARLAPLAKADLKAWGRGTDFDAEVAYLKQTVKTRHDLLSKELVGACARGTLFENEPEDDNPVLY